MERRQYSAATAKQSRFKEAALAAQEQAAATEEGETQTMMFTLLQEQHQSQLEAMAAANKEAMEAMMERMNALVTAQGGRKYNPAADKENEPPPTNRGKEDDTVRLHSLQWGVHWSFSLNLKQFASLQSFRKRGVCRM